MSIHVSHRRRCYRAAASVTAIMALSAAMPALAQTASTDTARDDNSQLGEIIVTARKTNEQLQSTPIAITAVTAETVERKGLADIRDIANISPSVTVSGNNQFGEFPVAIRGVAASSSGIGADDPVAVYLDGVYIGRPAGTFFEFGDIERVEVLRGPQGTLYGRNATAGAINVISKEPSDVLTGRAYVGYGSFNTLRSNAYVTGPISDKAQGKISGFYSRSDGFEKNLFDGGHINGVTNYGGRVALKFEPTDTLTISLSGDLEHQEDPSAYHSSAPGPFYWNAVNVNEDVHSKRDLGGVAATIEQEIGSYTLKSITGYRGLKLDYVSDSDGTPAPAVRNSAAPLKQRQFSEELQIISDPTATFSWIGGLYYFYEHSTIKVVANATAARILALNLDDSNKTNSYAAFAQGNLKLTDKLKITAGIRYTHDKKDFVFSNLGVAVPTAPVYSSKNWGAVTPHASLNYQATPTTLLYANVTRGFKAGGFNFAVVQSPFDPEKLWSYEAGVKTDLLDRHLRLNLAVFRYDYTDLQVRQNPAPGIIQVRNAGTSKVTGVELEGSLIPFDGLRFDFGGSYLDAKYTEFTLGAVSYAGNMLARSPKAQGFVTGSYVFSLGNGKVDLSVTGRHQSTLFFSEANLQNQKQRNHSELDARLGYDLGNWSFAVLGKNLTDQRYLTNALAIGANLLTSVNAPASVMGEVRYRF